VLLFYNYRGCKCFSFTAFAKAIAKSPWPHKIDVIRPTVPTKIPNMLLTTILLLALQATPYSPLYPLDRQAPTDPLPIGSQPDTAGVEPTADEVAVRRVLEGYLTALYDADSTLVDNITDQNLQKSGHYYSPKRKSWSYTHMSYAGLKNTAATYNAKGWIPSSAPRKIEVFEVKERIAVGKVEAIWGMDYVLLSKNAAGDWRIDKILWQSYSSAVTIDGNLTPDEWKDATRAELTSDGSVFYKADTDAVYLGLRGDTTGWATVYLTADAGKTVYVLHASAALGTAIFRQTGDRWSLTQSFEWAARHTDDNTAAKTARQAFYQQHGWIANVSDGGGNREREYKISRSFFTGGSLQLAVVYAAETRPLTLQHFPATLADATLNLPLIRGETPADLAFDIVHWQPIDR
jgi:hypothetical protein